MSTETSTDGPPDSPSRVNTSHLRIIIIIIIIIIIYSYVLISFIVGRCGDGNADCS